MSYVETLTELTRLFGRTDRTASLEAVKETAIEKIQAARLTTVQRALAMKLVHKIQAAQTKEAVYTAVSNEMLRF